MNASVNWHSQPKAKSLGQGDMRRCEWRRRRRFGVVNSAHGPASTLYCHCPIHQVQQPHRCREGIKATRQQRQAGDVGRSACASSAGCSLLSHSASNLLSPPHYRRRPSHGARLGRASRTLSRLPIQAPTRARGCSSTQPTGVRAGLSRHRPERRASAVLEQRRCRCRRPAALTAHPPAALPASRPSQPNMAGLPQLSQGGVARLLAGETGLPITLQCLGACPPLRRHAARSPRLLPPLHPPPPHRSVPPAPLQASSGCRKSGTASACC